MRCKLDAQTCHFICNCKCFSTKWSQSCCSIKSTKINLCECQINARVLLRQHQQSCLATIYKVLLRPPMVIVNTIIHATNIVQIDRKLCWCAQSYYILLQSMNINITYYIDIVLISKWHDESIWSELCILVIFWKISNIII